MFERIEQQFGPVDYLVNNAGINRDVLLAFMSDEQWDEVIDTNLRGTYLCSRLALPGMMRRVQWSHLQYRFAQPGFAARPASAITRHPKAASSPSPRRSPARWGNFTSG
jgi:NAD(P)-dependent dehydrogenase (short-subunit alcohol dehydrogenase family)